VTKPKPPEQKAGAKPLPTPKVGGIYKAEPGEVPRRVTGTGTGTDISTANNPNPAPSPAKTGQPPTPPGDE